MQCWCAWCKTVVAVVQLERWDMGDSGEDIVRGACAVCGSAIGEIGVYAPARAALVRGEQDRPAGLQVAASKR